MTGIAVNHIQTGRVIVTRRTKAFVDIYLTEHSVVPRNTLANKFIYLVQACSSILTRVAFTLVDVILAVRSFIAR